jgi:REP element-mobilizing transposase RayT
MPTLPNRQSIRLKGYDYSQAGAYFVTITTHNRQFFLGEIRDGSFIPSQIGNLVTILWQNLPSHFPIFLDEWIVMPNHLHGIIVFPNDGKKSEIQLSHKPISSHNGSQSDSLSAIIQNFKSLTTRKINAGIGLSGSILWQRNFYEHVIRNEADLERIREYILNNPLRWELDDENPVVPPIKP